MKGYENVINIAGLVVLIIMTGLSISDIRYKEIPQGGLCILGGAAVIYQLISWHQGVWNLFCVLGGIGVGVLFLIISRCTEEAIGYGDSIAITILGAILGFWKSLEILSSAFFLCVIWTIVLSIFWKIRRKTLTKAIGTIPFMPFLTLGYAFLFIEYGGAL